MRSSINGADISDCRAAVRGGRFRLGTNASTLEESQNAMAEKTVPLNSTVTFESRSVHLTNGLTYYVTLVAANGACPELVRLPGFSPVSLCTPDFEVVAGLCLSFCVPGCALVRQNIPPAG